MPDMQGEGEENHTEGGGEKVLRRYLSLSLLVFMCTSATPACISLMSKTLISVFCHSVTADFLAVLK